MAFSCSFLICFFLAVSTRWIYLSWAEKQLGKIMNSLAISTLFKKVFNSCVVFKQCTKPDKEATEKNSDRPDRYQTLPDDQHFVSL